jgi:hypothetical protein
MIFLEEFLNFFDGFWRSGDGDFWISAAGSKGDVRFEFQIVFVEEFEEVLNRAVPRTIEGVSHDIISYLVWRAYHRYATPVNPLFSIFLSFGEG